VNFRLVHNKFYVIYCLWYVCMHEVSWFLCRDLNTVLYGYSTVKLIVEIIF
jgi:hypothetical protein